MGISFGHKNKQYINPYVDFSLLFIIECKDHILHSKIDEVVSLCDVDVNMIPSEFRYEYSGVITGEWRNWWWTRIASPVRFTPDKINDFIRRSGKHHFDIFYVLSLDDLRRYPQLIEHNPEYYLSLKPDDDISEIPLDWDRLSKHGMVSMSLVLATMHWPWNCFARETRLAGNYYPLMKI
jgi:hypothetical protein